MSEREIHENDYVLVKFRSETGKPMQLLSHVMVSSLLCKCLILISNICFQRNCINCLFVLRFYGPVNPMGSCRVRSVYLTTRLLGRLSPLSG